MVVLRKKKISLKDVASKSQTSIATVSKVLNNIHGSMISKKKRGLIKKIAKELCYRPNRNARLFSQGKSGCIAAIFPVRIFKDFSWRTASSLTFELFSGVANFFSEVDYTTILVFSPDKRVKDFLRKELLHEQKVDGVLFFGGNEELSMGSEFSKYGIPSVSFDWRAPEFGIPLIEDDPYKGLLGAVKSLSNFRHRRVGCIYLSESLEEQHVIKRKEIFLSLCAKNGIEVDLEACLPALDETDSYLLTQNLAKKGKMPTALFYTSDHFAILGIRALMEMGKNVPQDVSIIGYDDASYSIHSPVPLSTIRVPRKEIGRAAGKLLLELRENREQQPNRISLSSKWIERASIGENLNSSK